MRESMSRLKNAEFTLMHSMPGSKWHIKDLVTQSKRKVGETTFLRDCGKYNGTQGGAPIIGLGITN